MFGCMLVWLLGGACAQPPAPALPPIRGMTLSTPTWGREWGTDATAASMETLSTLGVNWVSYHPYARISDTGAVTWRPFDPGQPPDWLARPVAEAHARGMKVMVTPHLAHWGSSFSWRGAIAFGDEESRERFFSDYERFIVAIATAARGADAIVVGSELDQTALGPDNEARWRKIIASVREVYPGPITYAANWDSYDQIPFWDSLDAVGIQAYFPLSVAPGVRPSEAALDRAWDKINAEMHAFHEKHDKYIVFTELGYDSGPQAAIRPWESGDGSALGEEIQQACLAAALRAMERERAVLGAFLWKWFPGDSAPNDFRMSAPSLREAITRAWREPPRGSL